MHVSTVLLVFATVLSVVCADSSYLLTQDITPTPNTYTVWLSPDLDQKLFDGNLSLTITTKANVNSNITLHSSNITIRSIEVLSPNEDDIFESYELDSIREFLIIKLTNDTLPNQNYTINILYIGSLQDNMRGFYRSTYTAEDGTTKNIAATQFQPTHARKAFPCFDEPRYKATFKITISTPVGYHSLANTLPVEGCVDDTVRCDIVFEETPIMSTYLVAFVVSDFNYYYTIENDLFYRSWARPNAMDGLIYSISVSPGILQAMEEYVDIPFSHPGLVKLDQVALPDFSAGAMENWGLITYRETALLYREGVNTASNKQRVATVIAHEIAHSWFGNLVTTDWWDTTWLNEGFAQLFQYYAASKVETDWRLMEQFVVAVQQVAFTSDAVKSAHPLTSECYTPSQVSGMFSTITYSKGASVLRMWSHSLTEDVFKTALRTYQVARQLNIATPSHLFSHIQTQAQANSSLPVHVNIQYMLRSWTEQPGFPVVNVERNYNNSTATITQHRFLLSPETDTSADVLLWKIPINWATESSGFEDTKPITWLTGEDDIISTGLPGANEWVIFNVQETGYYRVNYDAGNWNLLIAALLSNHLVIHPLNRAQLLDDSLNLARAGELDYDTALRLTAYLRNELDYIPWYAALSAFSILNRRFNAEHEDYPYFTRYILELVDKVYNDLSFEDSDSHIEKLHRSVILNWACNMGNEACNENANTKFRNFVENNVIVPPDLQSVVYCVGLRNSGYAEWEFLWNRFINSLDFSEQAILITALGCTRNTTTLDAYLQKAIDGVYVRLQDAASVFSAVYGNRIGVTVTLEFLDNNFYEVLAYYGSVSTFVSGIAARMSTVEQRDKLVAFVDKYSESLGSAGPAAIQTVEENLLWTATQQDIIFTYLKSAVTTVPPVGPTTVPPVVPTTVPPVVPTTVPPVVPTTVPPVGPTTVPPVGPTTVPPVGPTTVPPVGPTTVPPVGPTTAPPVGPTTVPPVVTTTDASVETTTDASVEITTPGAGPHVSPFGPTILLALLTTILLQFR